MFYTFLSFLSASLSRLTALTVINKPSFFSFLVSSSFSVFFPAASLDTHCILFCLCLSRRRQRHLRFGSLSLFLSLFSLLSFLMFFNSSFLLGGILVLDVLEAVEDWKWTNPSCRSRAIGPSFLVNPSCRSGAKGPSAGSGRTQVFFSFFLTTTKPIILGKNRLRYFFKIAKNI
jgi:hypothetical protein